MKNVKLKFKNAAYCVICQELLVSVYRHHFVSCLGRHIFLDGGADYQRIGASEPDIAVFGTVVFTPRKQRPDAK